MIAEVDFDRCFFYDLAFSPFEGEGSWEGSFGGGEYFLRQIMSQ